MNSQLAAQHLYFHLSQYAWLTSVGVGLENGKECIYVYASRSIPSSNNHLPSQWEGYPVLVKRIGTIKAVSSYH